MSSKPNISIVIPTIGNRNLIPTIESLNNSIIGIDEIIISIPFDVEIETGLFHNFSNLIIYKSRYKGQVAQRIEGFKIAKNDIIVQLDDDIILERNCLKLMYDFIKLNKSAAVSAHFHNIISKKSIYSKGGNKIYNKIKNGKTSQQNGGISKSGFETYPNFQDHKQPFISGWIPGGCVMHLKRNLVLSNFFPFQGKAYCEDLYHSIALKKKNINLYYHPNAKAFLKIDNVKSNFTMFIQHLRADFTIRKKLVEQNKLSKSRMFLVYFIKLLSYLFK